MLVFHKDLGKEDRLHVIVLPESLLDEQIHGPAVLNLSQLLGGPEALGGRNISIKISHVEATKADVLEQLKKGDSESIGLVGGGSILDKPGMPPFPFPPTGIIIGTRPGDIFPSDDDDDYDDDDQPKSLSDVLRRIFGAPPITKPETDGTVSSHGKCAYCGIAADVIKVAGCKPVCPSCFQINMGLVDSRTTDTESDDIEE